MRADSIAFALSGILFGVIVGWILGSQQAARPTATAAAPPPAAATAPAEGRPPAPPLDEARLKTLVAAVGSEPANPAPRVELGNLYFDAERYTDAVQWYEDALRLNPKDANVSTDLGVAYYYTNEPDKAIGQFEQSLEDRPGTYQDDVEHGHREGLRQAGPGRRQRRLAAGDRHRADAAPRPRPPARPSRACSRRIPAVDRPEADGGPALLPAGGDGAAGHPRLRAAVRRRDPGHRGLQAPVRRARRGRCPSR